MLKNQGEHYKRLRHDVGAAKCWSCTVQGRSSAVIFQHVLFHEWWGNRMRWTRDLVQHTVPLLLKKAKPEGNMRKILNIYRPSTAHELWVSAKRTRLDTSSGNEFSSVRELGFALRDRKNSRHADRAPSTASASSIKGASWRQYGDVIGIPPSGGLLGTANWEETSLQWVQPGGGWTHWRDYTVYSICPWNVMG